MKFGIVIATYYREDGGTRDALCATLDSVASQEHSDFKVFLVGDDYENDEEFQYYEKLLPSNKIQTINLPIAIERSRYGRGLELWSSGGVTAYNFGIKLALYQGYSYIAHLDHDDIWKKEHLSTFSSVIDEFPETACLFTSANFINSQVLPRGIEIDGQIRRIAPKPEDTIHSSTCLDFSRIHLRYRDVFHETGKAYPADADLWARLIPYCETRSLTSMHIAKITCSHLTEGYVRDV